MSFETTANREDTRRWTRRSASLAATRHSRGNRRDCADLDQRTRPGQATVYTDEMFEDVAPAESVQLEPGLLRPPTRQDLAPRIGQWRAWFEWAATTSPRGPQSHRRGISRGGEDDPISVLAVGLDLDDLRSWLEREADPVTAKAVLLHYRPDTIPLSMGKVLAPRVVR